MARPVRIEFKGTLYHITLRGNALGDVYKTDNDGRESLSRLNIVCNCY